MPESHTQKIIDRIFTPGTFVRAAFGGCLRGRMVAWTKVLVRPVEIKGIAHLQVSCFDGRKDITKNYRDAEARAPIAELLDLPFSNFTVVSTDGRLTVRIAKSGRILVDESSEGSPEADLSHDRKKKKILSAGEPFLRAVGIATADGAIRSDRQDKFKQINEFLKLLDETGAFADRGDRPVRVVDFGCGNAYLTFATYHYFANIRHIPATVTGVDIKADLLQGHREKAKSLGWDALEFVEGQIADYTTGTAPDAVIALHACDTATDDALARAIGWGSGLILCAPCCQHHVQTQMTGGSFPGSCAALSHDGILGERLGDILTDAFRATILRIMGYRTDVVQFVSTEHTAKNLMIRAVKAFAPGQPRWTAEYRALKEYWRVTPYLEASVAPGNNQWF